MRISTGLMFDRGTSRILDNQSTLFKIQNQMATGRRILTPADDPVASAQALITTQSKNVNKQFMANQTNAKDQLGLVDGNLDGLTQLIHDVRERSVQLGNASLTGADRGFIADEFRSRFEDLMGLANTQNGNGQYLFSGYQGATKPFGANPASVAPHTAGPNAAVIYFGDQGERQLQVDASRQMGVTASGLDVFMGIRNGNGEFSVSTPTVAPLNKGTGIADQGSVLDISKLNASPVQPFDFQAQFKVDATVNPPVTYYNLVDAASTNSMFSNAAPTPWPLVLDPLNPPNTIPQFPVGATDWKVFTPGQSISFSGMDAAFGTDIGIQFQVTGSPADGDRFAIASSENQSIFDTVKNLIAMAGQPVPVSSSGNTEFMNDLDAQVTALDNALNNVLRIRASVGARLNELDALESTGSDLDLQFENKLAGLQDLDYASAITSLSRRQMQLEAAQTSFVRITGLSLFSEIR